MTENNNTRDRITVEDAQGNTTEFVIEALFDMNEESYALLQSEDDIVLMRVVNDEKGQQYLEGIDDPEESASILAAYQVAVDAAPANDEALQ